MTLTLPSTSTASRIVFVGIDCDFTRHVLTGLLNAGVEIAGMILPGAPGIDRPLRAWHASPTLPLADTSQTHSSIATLLADQRIPAFRLGSLRVPDAVQVFRSFHADTLVCACYPQLIPASITRVFPRRAVNVHPSLLPDKRGPDPLFWTFRNGSGISGVTIHDLAPRFDAGHILAQVAHRLEDGTTESELERSLATLAVQRMVEILPVIDDESTRTPQDEAFATYAPWPDESDFRLDTSMTARAAFNFVRGVEHRGVPITASHNGTSVVIHDVLAYGTRFRHQDPSVIALEFSDGFLFARLRSTDR